MRMVNQREHVLQALRHEGRKADGAALARIVAKLSGAPCQGCRQLCRHCAGTTSDTPEPYGSAPRTDLDEGGLGWEED